MLHFGSFCVGVEVEFCIIKSYDMQSEKSNTVKSASRSPTFIVPEKPGSAGIDPWQKMIDVDPNDNLRVVNRWEIDISYIDHIFLIFMP